MSNQHKKPILAFVVLAVIVTAVIGNQFRASAEDSSFIAAGRISAHTSVRHGAIPGQAAERPADTRDTRDTRDTPGATGPARPGPRQTNDLAMAAFQDSPGRPLRSVPAAGVKPAGEPVRRAPGERACRRVVSPTGGSACTTPGARDMPGPAGQHLASGPGGFHTGPGSSSFDHRSGRPGPGTLGR